MADSPASSDLSDPPSAESDGEDQLSTPIPSSRPSVDITHADTHDHLLPPPSKRRKTSGAPTHLSSFDRALSALPAADDDDQLSISSDGFSSAPGSPSQNEYALREEAQLYCLWKDCDFGEAKNNDELVKHVQGMHCATGGPKKTKYVCEWGECQRKTSNHPSGYALKAHMRSHTKEKPYYCALPECDKAFTRSDALAKHMRTVHEPESARPANDPAPLGSKKSSIKIKLTNGNNSSSTTVVPPGGPVHSPSSTSNPNKPAAANLPASSPPAAPADAPPTHDEDGNPVPPSPYSDNISYTPAHHPITGQPGFMITYPPDIHFSAWESAITADQLLRLLRRQVHWARQEGDELRAECRELEKVKRQEWELKEILLEGVMESELARGEKEGLLAAVDERVREAMEADTARAKQLEWSGGPPAFRTRSIGGVGGAGSAVPPSSQDVTMISAVNTPPEERGQQRTPSPPPTGKSGGFDGDADPYDNYLAGRMAEYEERERLRSLHNTPVNVKKEGHLPPPPTDQRQEEKEAEAVGALVGMSAGVEP